MGKKKATPNPQDIYQRGVTQYNQSQQPTKTQTEFEPVSQTFMNNYNQTAPQNIQDYGNIMKGYQGLNVGGPTKFSYQKVSAPRPAELNESYGYLREAAPGYREFAQTGGYSPTDIQELRARGTSPIRAAYGNTQMQLDRARSLGGGGGAPNYIAAASKAQRELPGQMADAMTGVNAQLAEDIRAGKLQGLAGITGIGSTMGGLSSDEAGRQLQAALANQGADIQTQGMGEQSRQFGIGAEMNKLQGQASLYGTTPGMANTFGNQALDAYKQRAQLEQAQQQFGLGAIDAQIRASQVPKPKPWWQTALGVAGTIAPYAAMMFPPTAPLGAAALAGGMGR